jgi:hypothetical protein
MKVGEPFALTAPSGARSRASAATAVLLWLTGVYALPLAHNINHHTDHTHGRALHRARHARPTEHSVGQVHDHDHDKITVTDATTTTTTTMPMPMPMPMPMSMSMPLAGARTTTACRSTRITARGRFYISRSPGSRPGR